MPDGGLITPVLKNADSTDIYQLSRWVVASFEEARVGGGPRIALRLVVMEERLY